MAASYLLKEDGGKLLQENGGGILLENSGPPTPAVTGGQASPFFGPPTLGPYLVLNSGWQLTGDT